MLRCCQNLCFVNFGRITNRLEFGLGFENMARIGSRPFVWLSSLVEVSVDVVRILPAQTRRLCLAELLPAQTQCEPKGGICSCCCG